MILDARIGGAGCMRSVCQGTSGHHSAPGLQLGGFVGANLFGLIEFGIEGGWSAPRPRDVAGRNALTLYGLDPSLLQQALAAEKGLPLPSLDFSVFDVNSAKSRTFDIGPSVRIHFLRKGRGLLFVGAGIHYQLYSNRYTTGGGDLRLGFHGASLPLRVGGGVMISRSLALMADVSYSPAIFGLVTIRLPDQTTAAPLKVIEDASNGSVKFTRTLPHFWGFTLTLRFRLGR